MKLRMPYITAAVLVVIVGALLIFLPPVRGSTQVQPGTGSQTQQDLSVSAQPAAVTGTADPRQFSFREVTKKILPSVVEINVSQVIAQQTPQSNPLAPFFDQQPGNGGGQGTLRQTALGSGIIVQRSGNRYYVLTNNHVVTGASDISIRLYDQRDFKATVVGADTRKDVALVSFDSADAIPVAELGDSGSLQVGDLVLAVGSPFGFESSVTMGIVSALGRQGPQGSGTTYTDYIQTDAAINEGNSGGALVNIQGQVIGINTWIAAPTGGSVGLGFAIPINNASPEIAQFIAKGKVQYGWLGVEISDIQNDSTYLGIAQDLNVDGVKGAFVVETYKGSPADKAGLLPGDYITKVDSTETPSSDALTQVVGGLVAGRTYTFSLVRYGKSMTLPVKIGVRDDQDKVAQTNNLWPGMTVIDINDQVRQEAGIPADLQGVVVGYLQDQNTPAAVAGFQTYDVITSINGRAVSNMMDYYKALNDTSRRQVAFDLVRQGTQVTVTLTR